MPSMKLFGIDLAFVVGGAKAPKPLGGYPNTVAISASVQGEDLIVDLDIDGEFPAITFNGLKGLLLRGSEQHGRFVPKEFAGSDTWFAGASVRRQANFGSYNVRLDADTVRPHPTYGFLFDDSDVNSDALSVLDDIGILRPAQGSENPWWRLAPNLSTKTLDFVADTPPAFTLAGERNQTFVLRRLSREAELPHQPARRSSHLEVAPTSGFALFHSERLAADALNTPHLHHYAATNGVLKVSSTVADGGGGSTKSTRAAAWAGPDAVLMPLRLTDESGNPVALKTEVTSGFALKLIVQYPRSTYTTLALAPVTGQKVRVHAIDVASLPPLDPNATEVPYWLGRKKDSSLCDRAPYEINGIARNLRLVREVEKPTDDQKGWPATLNVGEWLDPDGSEIRHTAAMLRLVEADRGWKLRVQMPERAISPLSPKSSSAGAAVLERVADCTVAELGLPMQDFAWTVANTSQRQSAFAKFLWDTAREADRSFCSAFAGLALSDDRFAHAGGARADLLMPPTLSQVLAIAADSTEDVSETALATPKMLFLKPHMPPEPKAVPSLRYVLGGGSDSQIAVPSPSTSNSASIATLATPLSDPEELRKALNAQAKPAGEAFDAFCSAWLLPKTAELRTHLDTIRTSLKLYRIADLAELAEQIANGQPIEDDVADAAAGLALDLIGALESGALELLFPTESTGEPNPQIEAVVATLGQLTSEEFITELFNAITGADEEPWLLAMRWCLSPPTYDLFRQIFALLKAPQVEDLATARDALLAAIRDLGGDLIDFDGLLDGFLGEVREGISDLFSLMERLWAASVKTELKSVIASVTAATDDLVELIDTELIRLRATYGPILTQDVYARLLADDDAVATLTAILRNDLGQVFRRLCDISAEPPEYFVVGRRLQSPGRPSSALDLWNTSFDLCRQATTGWSFFLDDETAVIVKLGSRRPLSEIIIEIQDGNASALEPNPLRLPNGDVKAYIDSIEPDLLQPDWVGAFVVRPIADISPDKAVAAVTGLNTIEAAYIAIGGAKPKWVGNGPALDIVARIFRRSDPQPATDKAPHDLDLSLVKFDVTIRNTQIAQGEIVTQINLQEVLGHVFADGESASVVLLSAVLPPAKPGDTARTFAFQAIFERPFVVPIDVFCVKQFEFKSLRVTTRSDDVSIDCDCDVVFQKPSGNFPGFDMSDAPLKLDSLRIRIPPLPSYKPLGFGQRRSLNFDFPAVSIALPRSRGFNFGGIDLIPRGLGFVRIKEGDPEGLYAKFLKNAMFLGNFMGGSSIPYTTTDACTLPFLDIKLELGSLPGFGGSGSLTLEMVAGLSIGSGGLGSAKPFAFIRGINGKNVELNFFRLLTLKIEELIFASSKVANGPSFLSARNIHLRILEWEPFKDGELDFLYVNSATGEEKGWALRLKDKIGSGVFKFYGMAVARGLSFDQAYYDALLSDPEAQASKMRQLIEQDSGGYTLNAMLIPDSQWMFAISFGVGEVLPSCSLVLQDGKYYGIRIGAPWLEPLIGGDSLSLAYIPGETRAQDRFRTMFKLPALDLFASMRSGEIALEWGVNRDFLVDIGFPWVVGGVHDWFRAFSVPMGIYEAKFGLYFQRRTLGMAGDQVTFAAGFGLYVGYAFAAGNSVAWVRAGIGIYGILEGSLTFDKTQPIQSIGDLRSAIVRIEIRGTVGIYAYGEGGIDYYVISARFRVSVDAYVECAVIIMRHQPAALTYNATLAAAYSASVRIGCGWFSWTFSVSGSVQMRVSGSLMLG